MNAQQTVYRIEKLLLDVRDHIETDDVEQRRVVIDIERAIEALYEEASRHQQVGSRCIDCGGQWPCGFMLRVARRLGL